MKMHDSMVKKKIHFHYKLDDLFRNIYKNCKNHA